MNIHMIKVVFLALFISLPVQASSGGLGGKPQQELNDYSKGLISGLALAGGLYGAYHLSHYCICNGAEIAARFFFSCSQNQLEGCQRSAIKSIALSRAVNCGDETTVAQVLQNAKDVSGKNEALVAAAKKGRREATMRLINVGVPIDGQDKAGKTPLMHASEQGRLDVVQGLLKRGASLHMQDKTGQTALLLALKHCHQDVAKVLIYAGAPVDSCDSEHRMTPLMWSAEHGLIDMLSLLLGDTKDSDPEELADPFTGRVDIHARDAEGSTALLLAVQNAYPEAAKRLIAAGASPNDRDDQEQKTVLMWAAQRGLKGVVVMLIPTVDTNVKDEHGFTAAELAKREGHREVADILFNQAIQS